MTTLKLREPYYNKQRPLVTVSFIFDIGFEITAIFWSFNGSSQKLSSQDILLYIWWQSRWIIKCIFFYFKGIIHIFLFFRFIAIVFPIKAHIVCTRRRTLYAIIMIWLLSGVFSTPTMLFNTVTSFNGSNSNMEFCVLIFPSNPRVNMFLLFKYTETMLFYFLPLLVQIVCYVIIGKNLFVGMKELHGQTIRQSPGNPHSLKCSDTIKARRGVIKMLVVSVLLYFISYSPHQVLLIYNTFSPAPFHQNWSFLVGVTVLAYLNSAGNPIIYCVFSEKYRLKFKSIFTCNQKSNGRDSETILLHSSSPASEYTLLYRKSSPRITK